jgi:hypothetical protein
MFTWFSAITSIANCLISYLSPHDCEEIVLLFIMYFLALNSSILLYLKGEQ